MDIDGSGVQRLEVNIVEIGEMDFDRTRYEFVDPRIKEPGVFYFGRSGVPLTQYQSGEFVFAGSTRGASGENRGAAHLLEDTMSEFHRQIALYQQRQPNVPSNSAPNAGVGGGAPAMNAPSNNGNRVICRAIR